MPPQIISLSLAVIMSLQGTALAQQSSRVDAIATSRVTAAQRELLILRHDIQRLDQALAETAKAIQKRAESDSLAEGLAVGGAALGLGFAALSITVSNGIQAINNSSSAALRLVSELQKGTTNPDTKRAHNAILKARQEILAAQAASRLDPKSSQALTELDRTLETLQISLDDYKDRENLNKVLRLTAILTQAVGAAITFYVAANIFGQSKPRMFLGPVLMTIGNIASLIGTLSPSRTEALLYEIAKTRQALAIAAAKLEVAPSNISKTLP